jgi:hypothetical protein
MVFSVMNVLRMVKLFGWEKSMWDRICEKREEELAFLWKRKLIVVANDTFK